MHSKRLLIAALLVLSSVRLAQSQNNYRMTGNLPGASLMSSSGSYLAVANIQPVDNNGTTTYLAQWGLSYTDPAGVNTYVHVQGYAPASAIQSRGTRTVVVDLDISMLTDREVVAQTCDTYSGICTPATPPAALPFRGTLQSNPGVGYSYLYTQTGNYSSTMWFSADFSIKSTFDGSMTRASAVFSGVIGAAEITPALGTSGEITVQRGTLTVATR